MISEKKGMKSAEQSTMQMEEVMQKDEKPTTKNPLNSKKASKNAGFKSTLKQEMEQKKTILKLPIYLLLMNPG